MRCACSQLRGFLERRDDRDVKKLNDTKKKMLKELKVSCNIQKLTFDVAWTSVGKRSCGSDGCDNAPC